MQADKPSVAIILDKRRALSVGEHAGKFPVRLRVTFLKQRADRTKEYDQVYFLDGVYLNEDEFSKVIDLTSAPQDSRLSKIRNTILDEFKRAQDIIDNISFITRELFEQHFRNNWNLDLVSGFFNIKINELTKTEEKRGKPGSSTIYTTSKNFVEKYMPGVAIAEITSAWLNDFEEWCLDNGYSYNYIGIITRNIRTIYKMAIKARKVPADLYPFGPGLYVPPSEVNNHKRFLEPEDKDRLISYKSDDPEIQRGVAFFTFSYLEYGINCMDICQLHFRDIRDGVIKIERQKTSRKKRDKTKIVIPMHPKAQEIMNKYANKSLNPDEFVFPVLSEGLSPKQIRWKVLDFIESINKALKKVSEDLKLPFTVTTYTARHTFATMCLRNGCTVDQIQEFLGHSDPKTTQVYLHGFGIKNKIAVSQGL